MQKEKKILFLHGFYASGQCVPALALKEAFKKKATVLTPDLPLHPADAISLIRDICDKEKPDVLVGNSCGSFYAQMISPIIGVPALLGNPHFKMSDFLRERIGSHQYKSPRANGIQEFTIDEQLISEFEELEAHQFDYCNIYNKVRVWGLFGEEDTLAHFEPLFLEHYLNTYHFPGGHTPTSEQVKTWYVPLIEKLMMEHPVQEDKPRYFQHFKGNKYRLVHTAFDSEMQQRMVGEETMMKKLCHYISEYMGLLVLAAALLALVFPDTLGQIRPTVINYLLGVVMFGMGLTLNLQDFKIVFSRPKDVIIGCLAQFTIMPLLAWGLARLFRLDEALALGVVLVGCCPGGTASNVITYLAKGDLALSVGMTGVSTLLAPLLTPLLTWALAGKSVDVDVASMFLSILWVVILPIVLGLLVKWLWPKFTEKATDYLPAFSSIAIAFIVAIIIAANADKLLAGGLIIVLVVMLHNVCGLSLGYLIGRLLGLSEPKKRAISIEVGMQNSGLASSLATIHFAAYPLATIPGAIFSVWHNLSGAAVAYLYRETIRQ